ncbi:peptidoglycan-binding domain-containing protein [Octadecabacter sp. 1_MG-2023]|uniref:peptidoglycan-binding domain-containing protein n=1 Tax=unclassified Octadecabacter TaxID=196158 RepID=UPI001C086409|nr:MULTISPECIES: peptidoglycan-binding domain-containing protein [unclassified Octadecabacter]MBU2992875.1 peptidoglycan-binding protein [Octadecabacter sp. B2R22]MDO6733674.1 peptidoglycan-binding domain-containing protein [Octadecabacter sp. 1_MG-2023]
MQTSPIQRTRLAARFGAVCSAAVIIGLSGCVETPPTRLDQTPADHSIGPLETPVVVDSNIGTCFARDTTPAVIETVTEQIMVQPAVVRSDGSVEQPAAFRTVTRQRILRERREVEFETPCGHVQTPEFIASVQRALVARGYYRGTITGAIDTRTVSAIERFQTDQNDVHTGVLTLKTARSLGLVALPRDQL